MAAAVTAGAALSPAHRAETPAAGTRTSAPNIARMCDYLLGGKDNYAADRESAERVLRRCPIVPRLVQANRGFLDHAVARLTGDAGLRQFADIGCGLPASVNVGELVRRTDPACRVAYLDNDPMVLVHARALLAVSENTGVVEADVRDPAALLADPGLRRLIDLAEPVGVFLLGVLDFIADEDDPRGIVDALAGGLAPGSHIVISHTERSPELDPISGPHPRLGIPFRPRSMDEITGICRSLRLIEPYPVRLPHASHVTRPMPLIGCIGRVPG